MIRSLYVRITATFLLIVLISTGISIFIANTTFKRDMHGQFEQSLRNTIARIEQLYNESMPRSLPRFIEGLSGVQGLTIVAISERGTIISAGKSSQQLIDGLTRGMLSDVFAGNVRQFELSGREDSAPPAIGEAVRFGGMRWALFVTPDRMGEVRVYQRNTVTIVATLLLVGIALILVAARYLVKPLKMMKAATGKIAQGDFSVQLPANRKDELGELADSINRMAVGLSQLETMRRDFVSNVSHEIQSPLTSIGGFAEALRSEQLSEAERNRYVGIIKQESNRLSRLSENLLKLASLDSQQHPFHPQPYRLDRQLRDVVLSCEPQWVAKQLTVELLMEETTIKADEDQLSQVWINLLSNSIKFTPDGGNVSFHLSEKNGNVVVRIADTGVGIASEERDRVFERFYKSDASRDRSVGGSGLGLSIVRKIIEIHGGSIEIEETDAASGSDSYAFGRKPASTGTVFVIRLPLQGIHKTEPKSEQGYG
ncbi:ATP-binding protein [Paenibacillus sp. NPDC058071]|uniref:sensor histidine kinase n=1 Tax=Paenibacillus sp. NPDC058071 TaxID=3346326 RepID=UPI0036DB4EF1